MKAPAGLEEDYRTAVSERDNPARPQVWRDSMASVVGYIERIAKAEKAMVSALHNSVIGETAAGSEPAQWHRENIILLGDALGITGKDATERP